MSCSHASVLFALQHNTAVVNHEVYEFSGNSCLDSNMFISKSSMDTGN